MKRLVYLIMIVLTGGGYTSIQAGCPATILVGQSQLDAYVASLSGCDVVEGDLVLQGGIYDVSGLAGIKKVEGSLILDQTDISNLYSAFPQLTTIGSNLVVTDNDNLGSITHSFTALQEVGGDLRIEQNDALFIISGFSVLESVEGDLIFATNHLLAHIPTFTSLHAVGAIYFVFNDLLGEIGGFKSLLEIDGDLIIDNNDILKSISAFSALKNIAGDLALVDNMALQSISGFQALVSLTDFVFAGNESMVLLSGFDQLQSAGSLNVQSNPALMTFEGFARLIEVTNDVDIINNQSLTYLTAFGALKDVGGAINIEANRDLKSISGFGQLQHVGSDLTIRDHDLLETILAFHYLQSVGGTLEISYNEVLSQIPTFPRLRSIGDDLLINDNRLIAINFYALENIGGELSIHDEPVLTELTDFSKLRSIGGGVTIELNEMLKKIAGFGKLGRVGDDFIIERNASLLFIDGFTSVTIMDEDLFIRNNPVLVHISGFSSLGTLGDDLRIVSNNLLESVSAFEVLESVDQLEVRVNPRLFYCCGLGHLVQVAGYASANISGNSDGCNSTAEIDAGCNATISDCTPNCIGYINAALDRYGVATIRPKDFISDTLACMSGVEVTIEDNLGATVFGPRVVGINGVIPIKGCHLLRKLPLKVTTRGMGGACWSELTFKQTNGPTVVQDTATTVMCGDPLASEPAPGTIKTAWIPCQPELDADWITDWVTPYDCDPGVQDTVKIIYREWEAYDKEGRRGVAFDTIYVLQLPEILPENIYCEPKDTVYCADTTAMIGPYITYDDPQNGCQQVYLVTAADRDNDGNLEFIPTTFDTKCGLTVHVDYKKFSGDCENNYRVTVDVKQHCYGQGDDMTCTVPIPAGMPPNAAEQIDIGYWRCEFWVVDLDTIAPLVVCKGDDLFSGPFDISNWGLYNNLFSGIDFLPTAALPMVEGFDLTKLPYALSVLSEKGIDLRELALDEVSEGDTPSDANGYIAASYQSNAVMSYEADRDETFSFSWDFTVEEAQDDLIITKREVLPLQGPSAVASIFYSLNGSSFRLVQGEPFNDVQLADQRSRALVSQKSINMIDPVIVAGSQYGFEHIPLSKGDVLYIIAVWDSPADATFRMMGLNQVSTSKSDCIAHSYIPPIQAEDDWSGVKQAKAVVEGVGTYQLTYDPDADCWSTHDRVQLPHQEEAYKVIYEVYDSCHNVGYDSCYLYVKDLVKPVAVIDKGFTVSLGDKKVWIGAEAFDEGSYDNCNLNHFLVRRSDWKETCVNLCDSLEPLCITDHHDTIWRPVLQPDKRVDPLEAHYAKTMAWIKNESEACGELLYNAWQYDLMKHATLYCKKDISYPLTPEVFRSLVDSCAYDLQPYFAGVPFKPGDDRSKRKLTSDLIEQYEQIGGGWSDQVVFSCEDACGPVTVEVLVMDYWCNFSVAWTKVWVEDKVPPQVVKDVVSEAHISCKTYKEKSIHVEGTLHPVSIAEIVEKSKQGDTVALAQLDSIFGGYEKAWVNPYGQYVDIHGDTIACDIPFVDSVCICTTDTVSVRVNDDHLGYIWKDSIISHCYYEAEEMTLQQGIVKANCTENVYCAQQIWCEFDHCGQGYIQRKFKIWQSCPSDFYGNEHVPDSLKHTVDTIYRQQRIWVGNECSLSKYMFEVPGDTIIYACGVSYDDHGNVVGDASPQAIGKAKYTLDDDCRLVGIAHQDKVFKIVGGGYDACYKIIRTWYFADWCTNGESTNPHWWSDYQLVVDSSEQVIFVKDTTAPVCSIIGPVLTGDTLEVGTCDYDLDVEVEMADLCGIANYDWQLFDVAAGDYALVKEGSGEWSGVDQATAQISIDDLPFSTYQLKVRIVDDCRNTAYCEYLITLQSVKKPSAICITSLTARLTPWDSDHDGLADTAKSIIWADEFDQSSLPSCGDDSLEFRLELVDGEDDETYAEDTDSLVLGCDQVGATVVRLWVISLPSGTVDYCDVVVIAQSDFDGCTPLPGARIVRAEMPIESITKVSIKKNDGYGAAINVSGDAFVSDGIHADLDFWLQQNRPNPFRDETIIDFNLPASMLVEVVFFDVTGRVLKIIKGDFAKGINHIKIKQQDLGVTGMIYYRLNADGYTSTRRMLSLP